MQIRDINNIEEELWVGFHQIIHADGCKFWLHDKIMSVSAMEIQDNKRKLMRNLTKKYKDLDDLERNSMDDLEEVM